MNPISKKEKIKDVFVEGAITSEFIAKSIKNHQSKTNIGAHNIFLGQVRADNINGRSVKAIDYEAYKDMANKKFHEIKESTFQKFNITCMHIYHSLGEVKVGQICFFVFISGKHRSNLNNFLKKIVKNIKQKAPIFGKETFEDDSYQWKKNK